MQRRERIPGPLLYALQPDNQIPEHDSDIRNHLNFFLSTIQAASRPVRTVNKDILVFTDQ